MREKRVTSKAEGRVLGRRQRVDSRQEGALPAPEESGNGQYLRPPSLRGLCFRLLLTFGVVWKAPGLPWKGAAHHRPI